MAALAEVVGALVDDDGSTNDRVRADERDRAVCGCASVMKDARRDHDLICAKQPRLTGDVDLGGAAGVGLDVACAIVSPGVKNPRHITSKEN